MRTPIEAFQEIKSRIEYFCAYMDGTYNPPWAKEIVGRCDDILKYRKNSLLDKEELAYLLRNQREINHELVDENSRLINENYQLRNELRIAIKRMKPCKIEIKPCKIEIKPCKLRS